MKIIRPDAPWLKEDIDEFEDLINEKLDQLDLWISNIEKSNKPYHIQPYIYSDIKKYIN